MNIYIVEDDQFHLEDLMITIEELGHTCIGNTDDPFEALDQIEESLPDAILIDIHLNGKKSGISLGNKIRSMHRLPVLFTTSDITTEIMSEAADVSPVAYLTKPIDKNELMAALILAEKRNMDVEVPESDLSSSIFVKSGNKLVKVVLDSILYIYTDSKNYCSLITVDNKKLSVRSSIQGLYKLLDKDAFIQTHRSYIINWKRVNTIVESDQTLEINGHYIPIGRTFRKKVYAKLSIL